MKKSVSVVIPTIREEYIKRFLTEWKQYFNGCDIVIIEDNPQKTFQLPTWVNHYSWQDIEKELGKNSWIIPRRSAAIRSYGFLKAWQQNADIVITLDDDCLPEENYKEKFVDAVVHNLEKEWDEDSWFNTLGEYKLYPRGYPYNIRDKKNTTVIHHGLWSNIPDLDGITQKKYPKFRTKPFSKLERIPTGKFYSMCSMNLAFRREILPAMYMLIMGEDNKGKSWGYDRFDDIWSGVFSKKICDHLSLAVSSGYPSVKHTRASSVENNIQKEKKGMEINEWLWKTVDDMRLAGKEPSSCYLEIAEEIKDLNPYFKKLSKAMKVWIKLLNNA